MSRKTDSNNPADWIRIAESDLEGIRILIDRETSYPLCASKCAEILEKILKAELIRLGWVLEKTHDLLKLGGELNARRSDLVISIRPLCESLADRYFMGRYPGFDTEEPHWPLLQHHVDAISSLLAIVKSRI